MADNRDNLVDMVGGDYESLKDVGAFLCFFKLETCAPDYNLMAVVNKGFYDFFEVEDFGRPLTRATLLTLNDDCIGVIL